MAMVPGGAVHDVTELNPSYAWAVGGIVSTAGDLARFLSALLGGRLLPAAVLEQMLTEAPGSTYGLGVLRWRLSGGVDVWGHNGMIHGSGTVVFGSRDGARVFAANANSDETDPGEVFASVVDEVFG